MYVINKTAQDVNGNAIAGASCFVYARGTTTIVPITDAAGAPKANPFFSATGGLIQFSAEPGEYDLRVLSGQSDSTIPVSIIGSAGLTDSGVDPDETPQNADLGGAAYTQTDEYSFVFNSVSEMVSSDKLKIGQSVKTLGYHSLGDGGGNDYEIVAAGTGTDDGGSYIDLSGSGLQAKGLFLAGVNVRQFGANGTDDQGSIESSVSYAHGVNSELEWPGGEYISSDTIPNFHNVRHFGNGVIVANGTQFYPNPRTGNTNRFYVSQAGDDSNDGLSSMRPMREIATAVSHLDNFGPMLEGTWVILPEEGSYRGGILIPRNLQSRDFIKIEGPNVGGHPNSPTAIISYDNDTSKTYGISAGDGILLWLEDIKISGAFTQAELMSRNVYYQRRNVHVNGAITGLQINVQCRYFPYGGVIENCGTGINELFHITRAFDVVSGAEQGTIIRNCNVGLKAKENCIGHTDYITFEDNDIAMELQLYSGTNPKGAVFKRNNLGIMLVNSEIHNENAIVWGAGSDANARRIVSVGNSSEINTFGWDGSDSSFRLGHRPLVPIRSQLEPTSITGTTSETSVASFAGALKADLYAAEGKHFTVRVKGRLGTGGATSGSIRMLVRVGGAYYTEVEIPSGVSSGAALIAEFDSVCSDDGNNQIVTSYAICGNTISSAVSRTTAMLAGDTDRGVNVSCILGNAGDTVDIYSVEVFG